MFDNARIRRSGSCSLQKLRNIRVFRWSNQRNHHEIFKYICRGPGYPDDGWMHFGSRGSSRTTRRNRRYRQNWRNRIHRTDGRDRQDRQHGCNRVHRGNRRHRRNRQHHDSRTGSIRQQSARRRLAFSLCNPFCALPVPRPVARPGAVPCALQITQIVAGRPTIEITRALATGEAHLIEPVNASMNACTARVIANSASSDFSTHSGHGG